MMSDTPEDNIARQGNTTAATMHQLVVDLHTRLNHDTFYMYRTGGEGGSGASSGQSSRRRTLIAFPSGDAALSFAQRNRLATTPRLVRIGLARLLTIVVDHASIEAVLFAREIPDDLVPGRLPDGVRIERATLLRALEHGDVQL